VEMECESRQHEKKCTLRGPLRCSLSRNGRQNGCLHAILSLHPIAGEQDCSVRRCTANQNYPHHLVFQSGAPRYTEWWTPLRVCGLPIPTLHLSHLSKGSHIFLPYIFSRMEVAWTMTAETSTESRRFEFLFCKSRMKKKRNLLYGWTNTRVILSANDSSWSLRSKPLV